MKKKVINKTLFCTALFLTSILLAPTVLANDVAYIYKNPKNIDTNFKEALEETGLTVTMISDSSVKTTDFSEYDLIFTGNERFRNHKHIPVNDMPSVISTYSHTKTWGLADNERTNKLAFRSKEAFVNENTPTKIYKKTENMPRMRTRMQYFYISDRNKATDMTKIAGTYNGENSYDKGDVIAHINQDTLLGNGKTAQGNICYFGLIATPYWTPEARQLFKDCVNFAIQSQSQKPPEETPIEEPENPNENPTTNHDVALVEFTNTIGNILLEHSDGTDILEEETITCNQDYKVRIKAENLGDSAEDITYTGSIGTIEFSHVSTTDLQPGEKTSIKTKTVNFALPTGEHTITVEAHITNTDSNPDNNIAQRTINIDCPEA